MRFLPVLVLLCAPPARAGILEDYYARLEEAQTAEPFSERDKILREIANTLESDRAFQRTPEFAKVQTRFDAVATNALVRAREDRVFGDKSGLEMAFSLNIYVRSGAVPESSRDSYDSILSDILIDETERGARTEEPAPLEQGESSSGGAPVVPEAVRDDLERGLERRAEDPNLAPDQLSRTQSTLGGVRLQRGDPESAMQLGKKAVKSAPANPLGWDLLARANMALGDKVQARAAAKRALQLEPRMKAATAIEKLTRDVKSPEAGGVALGQLRGDPGGAAATPAGGTWKFERYTTKEGKSIDGARPKGARKTVSKASLAWSTRAMEALYKGDAEGALQAARLALKEDANNAAGYAALSMALNALGRHAEAKAAAQAAVERDADSAEAYAALAWARYKTGDAKGALEAADRALARKETGLGYATKGLAWEALGEVDKMFQDLEAAAEVDPEAFRAMLEKAKRKYADREHPDLAVNLEPDFSPFLLLKNAAAAPGGAARAVRLAGLALAGLLVLGGLGSLFWGLNRRLTRIQSDVATPAAGPLDTPATRSRFTAVAEIGRGGMGVVYEAYEPALGRKVAIKRLNPETMAGERAALLKEARLVAKLQHPNIVTIHDVVEDDGELLLVFEHVAGKTLAGLLDADGPFTKADTVAILERVVSALDYAHAKSVLHRDLKPGNIMRDEIGHVKVMDFGIARSGAGTVSHATAATVIGTPAFMAPEQERGKASRASDYYALAVTAYQMLSGELPFPLSNPYAFKIKGEFPPLKNGLDGFFKAALDPDPERRLHDPEAFLDGLRG